MGGTDTDSTHPRKRSGEPVACALSDKNRKGDPMSIKPVSIKPFAALAALSLAVMPFAVAHADEYPLVQGDYVEVGTISIDDGHDLDYAKHLAGVWRKTEEFSLKQGWITGYEILSNEYKRAGEPDLYLVTRFARLADPAEAEKRRAAYQAYFQTTIAQEEAQSGERAKYRHVMGTMLLRQLKFRD